MKFAALLLLMGLPALGCGSPSGACLYKGASHPPETGWTDGCLSCSCGVPGSKSAGVLCVATLCGPDGSSPEGDTASPMDGEPDSDAADGYATDGEYGGRSGR